MPSTDLLTTRQAAEILGCSRQHVVNLCESGQLPHARIGSHRRISRPDLEAFAPHRELRREELRSLWLHRAVAGKVVLDPTRAIAVARRNLVLMREAEPRAAVWLDAWERVLDAGVEPILETLTSTSSRAVDLRQNTPFAGLLSERERLSILSNVAAVTADQPAT